MKDLKSNITVQQILAAQTATDDVLSSAVDRKGSESLVIAFNIGASGDTLAAGLYWTPSLVESDNNSDYTDVAAADIDGTLTVINADTVTSVVVGYKGSKRYVKAKLVDTGTTTNGILVSATAIKGHLHIV